MKKPRRHQGAAPKVRAIEVIVADCKAEIDAAKVHTAQCTISTITNELVQASLQKQEQEAQRTQALLQALIKCNKPSGERDLNELESMIPQYKAAADYISGEAPGRVKVASLAKEMLEFQVNCQRFCDS